MSQLLLLTSPEHCAKKGLDGKKLNKKFLYALCTFLLTLLSVVLLVWVILHPAKPQFYLKDVGFILVSSNPNDRVGVYYDGLRAYASYKGQLITTESALPPFYQGHGDTNVLCASLSGAGVAVAPSFRYDVSRDEIAGQLPIKLRLDGRVRWKVGTWISGQHPIDVDCSIIVGFAPGGWPASPITTQGSHCSTTL
ncbi:unnamed protein product [Spirodela intermedia]|uniref:Late embryogenesis abundant protein LEA-2 subgroup domain-containing protein n=1 Tax=Spirodela intermedia TaxID=51605 RepID=A0A7I8IGV8_SPIIN|nr:unnamed protein product [Spirodela intermedia]CAA6656092.1 unnamed protein product [Spirodela intermedia]